MESASGRYLVRMGNWPRGNKPSNDDLAVAFYDKGQLLCSYSTRDLIREDSKVWASVSHYFYLDHEQHSGFIAKEGLPGNFSFWFEFTTIDGIQYRFDIRTGLIVKAPPPVV